MKKVERVKIFVHKDEDQLEEQFAKWFDGVVASREEVPLLKGTPLVIISRDLVIRNYEGDETLALAIFYEHVILDAHESGGDRGQHISGGVSMIPGQKPSRRKR